jgi:hypothetical protein
MGVQPDAPTNYLRALQGRGTLRVPEIGREASRPYNRNHRFTDFYEFIKIGQASFADGLILS